MKIELIQPLNWSDLTFNQYKRLLKLILENKSPEGSDLLKLRLDQISIINPHLELETIGKLRATQVIDYFQSIAFIDEEPVKEIFNEFELDGKKFKQIKFNDLSLAQWIDAEKWGGDVLDHHKLIAIFYIKPDEYSDGIRDRVADYLDALPAPYIFYLVSQFFFIQTALERGLVAYSEWQTKKMMEVEKIIKNSKKIDEKLKRVRKLFGFKSSTT